MTVKVSKPAINVREELADLKKPTGLAGEAMLRAETPQEQFNLISAGRRNMVINGAMRVAQRGTSASSVGTGVIAATDRMKVYKNNSVVYTVSQSTDAPAGFSYSHKVVSTTGDSSLASGDLASPLFYKIEGQDLQHLGYGTNDAKYSTLSFWVKTNVTGTYSVSLYKTNSSSRIYAPLYTVTTANTWQYVSLTVPPDIVPHANTSSTGLDVYFNAMAGSSYTTQPTTAWTAYTTTNWAGGHTAQCFASNNDSWQIAGLQYEVGKVATPFEHRSYGEELQLCKRYHQKYSGGSAIGLLNMGVMNTATNAQFFQNLMVEMRSAPAVSSSNFGISTVGGTIAVASQVTIAAASGQFVRIIATIGTNFPVASNVFPRVPSGATGFIAFDAEL